MKNVFVVPRREKIECFKIKSPEGNLFLSYLFFFETYF